MSVPSNSTEFRLLGPLGVSRDGALVPLGPKHRTLLAALLLHANQLVTIGQLVDYLWGDRPPASALNLLRGYVSELRKVLGLARSPDAPAPALLTLPPGYLLTLTTDQLDLHAFERGLGEARAALERGDAGSAAATLRAAASLWRGEALSDIDSDVLRQREGGRLEELRLAALEERIEAELRLGLHDELIAELTAHTSAHPTRERFRGQLMLALYRAGRQADALEEYRTARRILVGELGIEPGAALRRLEQAILAADPALDLDQSDDVPAPWQVRPDIGDFTGRAKALATVRGLLEQDGASTAVVISAIAGKGGVGKTTLAVHVAHQLRDRFPDGQLYVNLQGAEAEPVPAGTVLARFLRALGTDDAAIPGDVEERTAAYRARIAGRRLLVVLDNAADEAQVRPLLPASPTCAVLITSRSRLPGLESAHALELDVLDDPQAIELFAKIVGPERAFQERAAAEEIVRLCGRLPLALRIAAAKLAAKPHWPLARLAGRLRDEHTRLNELSAGDLEVRASLALSYDGASASEQRAFRYLGLLPEQDFGSWVLAPILDCPAADADDLIERLVDQQLLETAGRDGAGQLRYRFHDLLRTYARERLRAEEPAQARQAALERFLRTYLVLVRTAGALSNPSGFHLYDDADVGANVDPALLESVQADSIAWFAAEQAGMYAAAEQAHAAGLWQLTWAITHTSDDFFESRPVWEDRLRAVELALDAARRAGHRSAEAISMWQLGVTYSGAGRAAGAMRWLEPCVALFTELGDRRRQAYALRALADLYRAQGRLAEASARLHDCLAAFESLGDLRGVGYTLGSIALIARNEGRTAEAIAGFERCLAIFQEAGDRIIVAEVQRRLGDFHQERGEWRAALDHFGRCLPVFAELGDRENAGFVHRSLGSVRADQAQFDAAHRHLSEALAISTQLGGRRIEGHTLHSVAVVRRTQRYWGADPPALIEGDPAMTRFTRGVDAVERFGDQPSYTYAVHGLGIERGEQGDGEAALANLDAALTAFQEIGDQAGEAQARYSLGIVTARRGDTVTALTWLEQALALFRTHDQRSCAGEALARIGDLHATAGDQPAARSAWEQALAVFTTMAVPDDPRIATLRARWS